MEKLQIIKITKLILIFLVITSFFSILYLFLNSNSHRDNINKIIFSKNEIKDDENLILISTGDIGLVRDVNYKIIQNRNPNYPFLNIAEYLVDADLTIINLEGPLIENCPIILEGFTFCGQSENVKGLSFAGVDAANLANNHTTNYGQDGLNQTIKILKENNINEFGLSNQIKYIRVKDKNIALLGFIELGNNWQGLNNATIDNVKNLNIEASKNADIVINAFHWGVEYTYKPTDSQILLAHTAIDNGADIILGNHPHWIQPIEVYKNKIIVYAQGNTIFDQDWSNETREGIIYKFIYRNGKFEKLEEKITIIENNSQPRFVDEKESKTIKSKFTGVNN